MDNGVGQWNLDPILGSNPDRPQEASDLLRQLMIIH